MSIAALQALPRLRPSLRLAALDAALLHSSPLERDTIAELQLSEYDDVRVSPVLLSALRAWPFLSLRARHAALATADPELPALLASLLDSHPSLAADLAAACITAPRAVIADPAGRRDLWSIIDRALARALDSTESRPTQEVLSAALLIAHRAGPALRAILRDAAHPGAMSLRSAARALHADQQRDSFIRWLAVPALAPVARERLENPDPADRAAALAQSHLLFTPARAAQIRRIARPERILLSAHELAQAPPALRKGQAQWIAHLPIRQDAQLGALRGFLDDPDAGARLAAVRAAARLTPSPRLDDVLLAFTRDRAGPVALAAAAALASAASPSRKRLLGPALERLADSPHPKVRAFIRAAVLPTVRP